MFRFDSGNGFAVQLIMTDQEDPTEEIEEELDEMEMDPAAAQEQEIEQLRETITGLHDMADRVKNVGRDLSENLKEKAGEAESDELQREYMILAESARLAYRRIEHGDNTIVRNGL